MKQLPHLPDGAPLALFLLISCPAQLMNKKDKSKDSDKSKTFAAKEKRKRDNGQTSRESTTLHLSAVGSTSMPD